MTKQTDLDQQLGKRVDDRTPLDPRARNTWIVAADPRYRLPWYRRLLRWIGRLGA